MNGPFLEAREFPGYRSVPHAAVLSRFCYRMMTGPRGWRDAGSNRCPVNESGRHEVRPRNQNHGRNRITMDRAPTVYCRLSSEASLVPSRPSSPGRPRGVLFAHPRIEQSVSHCEHHGADEDPDQAERYQAADYPGEDEEERQIRTLPDEDGP